VVINRYDPASGPSSMVYSMTRTVIGRCRLR
jgi:hypothetical protein